MYTYIKLKMKNRKTINEIILDVRGLECPIPVLKARKLAQSLKNRNKVKIKCTDPLAEMDFKHYCEESGHKFIKCIKNKNEIIIYLELI